MKQTLPFASSVLSLGLLLGTYSGHAQTVTNDKNDATVIAQPPAGEGAIPAGSTVGKEIPVGGTVLYVPAVETAHQEKAKAEKWKRSKKQRREDRREVTQVIGQSVNTYFANVYNVHTLQRF